jgi:hypothetical protein
MAEPAAASVAALCFRVYDAASALDRERCRWVMDRPWYDRLRAEAMTEDQEAIRAQAHASAWLVSLAGPPFKCPVCAAPPFGSKGELYDHVNAMADPSSREPVDGDSLFGIPLTVRADGGEPHLERS